jgi:hypothetical protein
MAEDKVMIACPQCHQEGCISPELLGDEVDCPSCKGRFVATKPVAPVMTHCPQCGSDKIIPDVPLKDHFGDAAAYSRQAAVEKQGAPQAWFFKDSCEGQVFLSICGECGHAAMRVSNARLLWAKHQRSKRQSPNAVE